MKSDGYKKTRNTRVYLCAASTDESGTEALEWSISNLVEDGDELVVVRGFAPEDLRTSVIRALNNRSLILEPPPSREGHARTVEGGSKGTNALHSGAELGIRGSKGKLWLKLPPEEECSARSYL